MPSLSNHCISVQTGVAEQYLHIQLEESISTTL